MGIERSLVHSPSILRLAQKLRNPRYRHTYVGAHVRQFLARQMRELRGSLSQADFGQKIGKAQNVVSRLEDPTYGKATLSTLLEIAAKLDRALIVRFVDFKTFLKFTEDQSDSSAAPEGYQEFDVSEFAWKEALKERNDVPVDNQISLAQRWKSRQEISVSLLEELIDKPTSGLGVDGQTTIARSVRAQFAQGRFFKALQRNSLQ